MKLTNQEINTIYEGLAEFGNEALPATVSYAIIRNRRTLQPIVEDFLEARLQVIKRNGLQVEDSESGELYYETLPENTEKAREEIQALLDVENEVNLVTFPLDALKDTSLSLKAMDTLYVMISEG